MPWTRRRYIQIWVGPRPVDSPDVLEHELPPGELNILSSADPRHGTPAGRTAHYFAGSKPCAACRAAWNAYRREYRAAGGSKRRCLDCGVQISENARRCRKHASRRAARIRWGIPLDAESEVA